MHCCMWTLKTPTSSKRSRGLELDGERFGLSVVTDGRCSRYCSAARVGFVVVAVTRCDKYSGSGPVGDDYVGSISLVVIPS